MQGMFPPPDAATLISVTAMVSPFPVFSGQPFADVGLLILDVPCACKAASADVHKNQKKRRPEQGAVLRFG